jgi:energy-coupling factor transport system ATP-binding protein
MTINDPSALIRLERLNYRYGSGKIILNDIDLLFNENEFTVIVGQNGSGKTTLLKNISGLLRPSGGTVFLRGKDTASMSVAEIAREIGFVMQDPDRQLFESTVYNEVAFALKGTLPKQELQKKVDEVLATVDLHEKRDAFPPSLDRAGRIKTVFASVLAMGSRIIVLDEPLAGQDKRGCILIMDILENLHRQGYTIIMVTHNISIASVYANRIIVMKSGNIVLDGSPEYIFTQTDQLAEAGILPPQITLLSQALRNDIPLEKDALCPENLVETLLTIKRKQETL